jgi:anti-sigma B factor antagonist
MLELQQTEAQGGQLLSLAGSLTIYEVGEARSQLLERVMAAPAGSWTLELQLDEFDTAGAQLLLALQRQLQQAGGALLVSAASDAVQELLDLLHLTQLWPAPQQPLPSGNCPC